MARRKKSEDNGGGGGSPAWMSTFSDLMNLLLCFFVLLFSMSTIDAEKFEELAASLEASFSIFDGGAASLTEGNLISSGVSQLNEFDDYYNSMGSNVDENEEEEVENLEQYEEKLEQEMINESEEIGEKLEQELTASGLMTDAAIDMEITAQYVMLTLNGAVLFDASSADIKASSEEFISKLGDVLKNYNDYNIEIIGHTDSRPMNGNGKYANNMLLSQGRAYTIFSYLVNTKKMDPSMMQCTGRGEYEPIASNTTAEGRAQNRRVEIKIFNSFTSEK